MALTRPGGFVRAGLGEAPDRFHPHHRQIFQKEVPVEDPGQTVEAVAGRHQGDPPVGKGSEQPGQVEACAGVHPLEGLVQDEEIRAGCQGFGQKNGFHLARGQIAKSSLSDP
jgi:hypothetical protein